jgi:rRNA-processing protein FCF1
MNPRRPTRRTPRGDPVRGLRGEMVDLVILDTNAALLPFRERFPLEESIERVAPGAELVVPENVRAELARLSEQGVQEARAAERWCERFRSRAVNASGDAGILEAAVILHAPVVTSDRALLEELQRRGLPAYRPRGRSGLLRVDPEAVVEPRRGNGGRATVIKRARVSSGQARPRHDRSGSAAH